MSNYDFSDSNKENIDPYNVKVKFSVLILSLDFQECFSTEKVDTIICIIWNWQEYGEWVS